MPCISRGASCTGYISDGSQDPTSGPGQAQEVQSETSSECPCLNIEGRGPGHGHTGRSSADRDPGSRASGQGCPGDQRPGTGRERCTATIGDRSRHSTIPGQDPRQGNVNIRRGACQNAAPGSGIRVHTVGYATAAAYRRNPGNPDDRASFPPGPLTSVRRLRQERPSTDRSDQAMAYALLTNECRGRDATSRPLRCHHRT